MIKIAFFDIDGTLSNMETRSVSDITIETLQSNFLWYKKDSCISITSQCIIHKLLIDIHESHYLRFARLYSLI